MAVQRYIRRKMFLGAQNSKQINKQIVRVMSLLWAEVMCEP